MAENSRLVAPVGTASSYGQDLLLVEKIGGQLNKKNLMRVVYVPLIGKYVYPA
jgi:protein-L-isoaspartate O-methyltransferase